ncbi:MAG: hypothetical protein E7574_03560 [Ruminococcaceae bacterium]|nr:hypothetical protein [Oscillospiraceae bacterium]
MMMTITEKIANLKGYLEGVQLDENKQETKVIAKIVDILEDMALEIEEMEESVDTLNDYAEELDEDLGDVEDYLFGEDDDCDCCDDDCDCDCCDEGFLEIDCPKCGETICIDEDYDEDEIICPACNEKIDIDED